jgi:putative transposase
MVSYFQPRVSDEGDFVEALLRMAGYRPQFPVQVFADLRRAPRASSFVQWYSRDRRNSGILYVSAAQRDARGDRAVPEDPHGLDLRARARNPRRWTRHSRKQDPITVCTLNPEPDSVIKAVAECLQIDERLKQRELPGDCTLPRIVLGGI